MKFRPSWRFWINVFFCILNLARFVLTGYEMSFWLSVVCCFFSWFNFVVDKRIFELQQKTNAIRQAFEKRKEEENKNV